VPWSEQWRLHEIAENAYHRDLDFDIVRGEAAQARSIAAEWRDLDCVAACHHLIARTWRVGDPEEDLDAAEGEWHLARAAIEEIAPAAREADLQLEWARLRIARSAYGEAAEAASKAAEMFRDQGLLRLVSEAKQVAGHALTLDGRAREGIELILEAREAARQGRFPEREIAACLALSAAHDELGDVPESNSACEEAIQVTLETGNAGEVSQAYSSLGLGRSELGDFAGAAKAFEGAFDSLIPATRHQEPLIACGLADSLFHLGKPEEALAILERYHGPIAAAPNHRLHAATLRWAIGVQSEEELHQVAAELYLDLTPVGQLAFALARVHAPHPKIASYLRHCEQLIERGEQHERLKRFRAANGIR
jgi:tetratricopeptide (TPR) repeat protein